MLPAITSGAPRIDVIHHCDALTMLKALPDQCVDITVTSPPYNILWKKHTDEGMFRSNKWLLKFMDGYDNYSDNMPEDDYQAWMRAVVTECMRVSKGLVWINHKTRYRNGVGIHPLSFLPFPLWSEVVWNRQNSMSVNHRRFSPSHEYVFGFGRPHYWNSEYDAAMSVWSISPERRQQFPVSYPERLIKPLIEASCPEGGLVLDPFMGSGTTAVVAKITGRHYLGCDISTYYVEQARERAAHASPYSTGTQPSLFSDAI